MCSALLQGHPGRISSQVLNTGVWLLPSSEILTCGRSHIFVRITPQSRLRRVYCGQVLEMLGVIDPWRGELYLCQLSGSSFNRGIKAGVRAGVK